MRGVGEATGAITVVNALSTGIGGAIGIGLRARAAVTVRVGDAAPSSVEPAAARTPLVEATLGEALARFHPGAAAQAELTLASEIPPGVGLKSSSAVQSAILLAVARSAGASVGPLGIADAAAEIALRIGASATGAFDDALAGLVRGAVVTDNLRRTLLRHRPLAPGLEVGLWLAPGTHPPSPSVRDRFSPEDPIARRCVDAALSGSWETAMDLNSELVERALGYPYGPLRAEVRRRGATAAGASGLGPAFAVVAPAGRLDDAMAVLPSDRGERRRVSLSSAPEDPGAFL